MNKTIQKALFSLMVVGGIASSIQTYAAKEFLNVSYDPTREFYQEYNKSFGDY